MNFCSKIRLITQKLSIICIALIVLCKAREKSAHDTKL